MKYWYKVAGYTKMTTKDSTFGIVQETLEDAAGITVEAETEAEALKLASKILKKPLYRVSEAGTIRPDLMQQSLDLNKQIYELNKETSKHIKLFGEAVKLLAEKV